MSSIEHSVDSLTTLSPMPATGDAVGVPETKKSNINPDGNPPTQGDQEGLPFWYVAITKTNKEKKLHQFLLDEGYDTYLPVQEEEHLWSRNRKRIIERLVIPGYVFIHCTEDRRKALFDDPALRAVTSLYLSHFMVNHSGTKNSYSRKPLATIPAHQMQMLMYMVGNSDTPVTIESAPLHVGATVRVMRGNLKGFTGELEVLPDNSTKLILRLHTLGSAKVTINRSDVTVVDE